jgi:hypothetical protein
MHLLRRMVQIANVISRLSFRYRIVRWSLVHMHYRMWTLREQSDYAAIKIAMLDESMSDMQWVRLH